MNVLRLLFLWLLSDSMALRPQIQMPRKGGGGLFMVDVMINGMPGPMALETAIACADRGFNVLSVGFTGPNTAEKSIVVESSKLKTKVEVELLKGPGIEGSGAAERLAALKKQYPELVVVDYTHPSATLNNVKCYVENSCDFVMGTTGGDPEQISKALEGGRGIVAVMAPNMAKQIVAVQAAILEMSRRFPGSFSDYSLTVTESHQSTKADTSGTAKAITSHLATLTGKSFSLEEIEKVRERSAQLAFGVPEPYLNGHAYHTYTLTSSDGTVCFELKHNVCGRRVYAEGTADAIQFVRDMKGGAGAGQGARVFNMIDVLESGRMK